MGRRREAGPSRSLRINLVASPHTSDYERRPGFRLQLCVALLPFAATSSSLKSIGVEPHREILRMMRQCIWKVREERSLPHPCRYYVTVTIE